MSGHSKWASIKHKKAATDAKRGRIFTRLIKEITIAAKNGGGDPEKNPRLRTAISTGKAANMPSENIDRAIKKGTGELPGIIYEEVTYEGYGPAGVAVIVETLTDNKNRTVADVRHIFAKQGGELGAAGCVSWMFTKTGLIYVPSAGVDEDKLIEIALNSGATDVRPDDDYFAVYTEPRNIEDVRSAIAAEGIEIESAEVTAISQTTVPVEGKDAEKLIKLLNTLEDADDTQKVYSNADIPEEYLSQLE
jgi:YebC/PmpR family DNA-binding regulatory protein